MMIRNALVMTTAVALALQACAPQAKASDSFTAEDDVAVCTDRQGNRVDDDLCDRNNSSSGGGGFFFMYLGGGSVVPAYGKPVRGGSKYATPGKSYTSSKSAVSRGGFGSSARASSSS